MTPYNEIYAQFKWPDRERYNFAKDVVDNWIKKLWFGRTITEHISRKHLQI